MRCLEEYEVAEEELYSHIGIFLDNNANLLRNRDEADGSMIDDAESRELGGQQSRTGGVQKARRQQPLVRIRDQNAAPNNNLKKAKKQINSLSGTVIAGEPVRKIKKSQKPRPPSPQFNTSLVPE